MFTAHLSVGVVFTWPLPSGSLAPSPSLQPPWEAAGHGEPHGWVRPTCQHGSCHNWITTTVPKTFTWTRWETWHSQGCCDLVLLRQETSTSPEHNLPFLPPSAQLQGPPLPPWEAACFPRDSDPSDSSAGKLVPVGHREGKRCCEQMRVCSSLPRGRRGPAQSQYHFLSGNPSEM